LAWGLGGTSLLGFGALVLLALWQDDALAALRSASGLAGIVLFAALGTLLALRQPANPIGWLLSVGALIWLTNQVADLVVTRVLASGSAVTTTVGLIAVVNEWIWPLGVLCSAALPLLLFPDGKVRSTRWRVVLYAMVGGAVTTVVSGALSTEAIHNPSNHSAPLKNPLGVEELAFVSRIGTELGPSLLLLCAALAVAGIVARLRSTAGIERQQLRWVASGALMAIAGVLIFPIAGLLNWPDQVVNLVFTVGFTCLPLSFTVAILRYRLYDLDRIISRTVTYAAVTGLLAITYAGLVTAASRFTPSGSSLAVAASTLAVAALFQPLRRRVQTSVDRRFNRTRYDAARTVEDFRLRLRDEVDLHAVRSDLLAVVHQTVQPDAAGLWLRTPAAGLPSAPGAITVELA